MSSRRRGATVHDAALPVRPIFGLALMLAGMVVLPVQDGLAKHLGATFPVLQVVWARYAFHLLFLLPFLFTRFSVSQLVPKRPGLQALRGVLMLASTTLFFAALTRLPLADTLALFFVSPLVVTALAPLVLGESVGWRRALAVATGFLGVVVVLRPGSGLLESGAALGLAAGVVHGIYLLVTRKLAGSASPMVTLGYTALIGAVVTTLFVGYAWTAPSVADLALMAALGLTSTIGHFLVIKAFDYAPAAWLAPAGFAEIVMATVVGLVVFGDFPDLATWLGIAIIIGSGVYISVRERRRRPTR